MAKADNENVPAPIHALDQARKSTPTFTLFRSTSCFMILEKATRHCGLRQRWRREFQITFGR